ncbi:hypothetical protein KAR91_11025 [Candidatus Pacearchaeota archaeon]|nr:hypothetical protein [Candidatus Pacearchaeota archaeon]
MTTITVSEETRVCLVRMKDETVTSLDKVIQDMIKQNELAESILVGYEMVKAENVRLKSFNDEMRAMLDKHFETFKEIIDCNKSDG